MCVQTHCSQADKSRGEICIYVYVYMSHILWLCVVFTAEEIQPE